MVMTPLSVALMFALATCLLTGGEAAKIIRKGSKDWSSVDWDKVRASSSSFPVVCCLLFVVAVAAAAAAFLTTEPFLIVSERQLEEDWAEGDEEEELKREDDYLYEEMERKKAEIDSQGSLDPRKLQAMHPSHAAQAVANAQAGNLGGPIMMFVDLKPNAGPNGVNSDER